MSITSRLYISISFLILLFNGSSIGYILCQERLGSLFGTGLFCMTSLLGVLFASITEETTNRFYSRFCMISNLLVLFYPLYFTLLANTLIPDLINALGLTLSVLGRNKVSV